ncbi:MAG: DNA mismatch repair protein MutS, partial [Pseudomonadota bacterium]
MARQSNKQNDDAQAPAAQKAQTGVTPSMAQFLEIKAANPDSLLWYRMGDFYELFFTDAVVAAEALGIILTKRGKHLGEDIPMCGVPVVRADEYLQRLIRQGFRVAVCEQLEDPTEARKRGSKAIVKRDVVRLVTPGTITEDALLDAKTRNYLTAIFAEPGEQADYALASLDISTGEFEIGIIAGVDLTGELVRLLPGEVLSVDAVLKNAELERTAHLITAALTPVPAASFDSLSGERLMCEYLNVSDLGAFGDFSRAEKAAVGALLTYVELTQLGKRPTVRPPRRSGRGATMIIDAASRASLEILRSTSGDRAGSLLAAIDRTVTGPGARELAGWISSPLRDLAAITSRQDAVAFLVDDRNLRDDTQRALRSAPDVARAISRLSLQRGGPRDLAAVRDAIAIAVVCADLVQKAGGAVGLPSALATIAENLYGPPDSLSEMLTAAIVDEPPALRREGGFVRTGYNQGLDDALSLRDDSRNVMASLEAKYAETSGVKTLKVRHNNILGYFIEVTAANAKPLMEEPLSDLFRHRQTMANAVRFTTVELSEIEGRIASAAERALAIENDIFAELANAIAEHETALNAMASALAELDCVTALGELA